jgi:hypothetical protein
LAEVRCQLDQVLTEETLTPQCTPPLKLSTDEHSSVVLNRAVTSGALRLLKDHIEPLVCACVVSGWGVGGSRREGESQEGGGQRVRSRVSAAGQGLAQVRPALCEYSQHAGGPQRTKPHRGRAPIPPLLSILAIARAPVHSHSAAPRAATASLAPARAPNAHGGACGVAHATVARWYSCRTVRPKLRAVA